MSKTALQHLIPSKTRRKILELFFRHPTEQYHLRRIARELDEQINAVAREVEILEKAKVIHKEKKLNKTLFTIREDCPIYEEILRLILKDEDLAEELRFQLPKLGKISYIVFSRALAKRQPIKEQEVYIMIIGKVVVPEVDGIISANRDKFPFELNYTVMTEEEFAFRKKNNDPFIWTFLRAPKIVIVGDEADLMK